MKAAGKADEDAVVGEAFAAEAVGEAGFGHQIDGALLEHAGADGGLDRGARAAFDDDGVDAGAREEMREHEPRRTGADDCDLRAEQDFRLRTRGEDGSCPRGGPRHRILRG